MMQSARCQFRPELCGDSSLRCPYLALSSAFALQVPTGTRVGICGPNIVKHTTCRMEVVDQRPRREVRNVEKVIMRLRSKVEERGPWMARL